MNERQPTVEEIRAWLKAIFAGDHEIPIAIFELHLPPDGDKEILRKLRELDGNQNDDETLLRDVARTFIFFEMDENVRKPWWAAQKLRRFMHT